MTMIQIKRVYEPAAKEDGRRFLVERSCSLPTAVGRSRAGNITLLYSAHDTKHNNAIALKSYLDEQLTLKKVEDS